MSAECTGPHFRMLILILTLTVLLLWYFYDTFSYAVFNLDDLETENKRLSNSDVEDNGEGYKTYKGNSNAVVGNCTVNTETESDYEVQSNRSIDVERTNTQNSPFIDKKFHLSTAGLLKNKTILWWNPPDWLRGFANFNMDQCGHTNCRVTFTQRYFDDSDAVIYSVVDKGMGYKPPVPANIRNPDQAWIFFTLESPVHINMQKREYMNPDWQNVFNWSWTYRTDSDIFHPYGTLVTKEIKHKRNYSKIFRKKTKLAAWTVSHCRTYSEREKYVNLLNKYAKVDIYGGCGVTPPQDLKQFISNNYKFYLGFENSLCNDYMTEKFFYYYKMDVITVVRGKVDYNRYLPKGSFINAADFPSIKALARFIQELAENENEYIKYLKLKDGYSVYGIDFMYREALCSVCEKLNHLEMHRKTYSNVSEWLGSCDTAGDLTEFK